MNRTAGAPLCELCGQPVLHGLRDYELYFCRDCRGASYVCVACRDGRSCPVCGSAHLHSVLERIRLRRHDGVVTYGQLRLRKEFDHGLALSV